MPCSLLVPGGDTELDRPSDPRLDGLTPSPSQESDGAWPRLEQPNPDDLQTHQKEGLQFALGIWVVCYTAFSQQWLTNTVPREG